MAPRITIVGGGSTHWTPRLLTDFANTPSLAGAEVALHDIDEPSLAPMLAIGKHIAASRDIGLQVTAGTDLPRALEGADFVISAFTVGGFESMRHDLEIPALHGLRQPVGDSVGPGGIFRSLRSIPVMVSIAREVERRAPGALLLNVSNPMTALCRAVTSQTSVRTVGLCNELVGLQFWLSLVFDVPMHEVDPTVAGRQPSPPGDLAAPRRRRRLRAATPGARRAGPARGPARVDGPARAVALEEDRPVAVGGPRPTSSTTIGSSSRSSAASACSPGRPTPTCRSSSRGS